MPALPVIFDAYGNAANLLPQNALPSRNSRLRASNDVTGLTFGGYSPDGYSGASYSADRSGFFYLSSLDTRLDLSGYTRTELLRRARLLYKNIGLVRRIIRGIANMVIGGKGLTVLPRTKDKEWNALAQKRFATRAASKEIWDVGGRFNFVGQQRYFVRRRLLDGDIGATPVLSASGGMRFRFWEAHQIANADFTMLGGGDQDRWHDGVLTDRANRVTAYSLVGEGGIDGQTPEAKVIPAGRFIYYGDYEGGGRVRCESILAHALNHIFDRNDIHRALKKGLKTANSLGYYIHTEAQKIDDPGADGNFQDQESQPVTRVMTPTGPMDLESFLAPGRTPALPAGKSYKILGDERPHPNGMAFLDDLVRDICWGTDYPPEVIWSIAKLGGASVRYVLAQAQSVITESQQGVIDGFAAKQYVLTTGADLATGALPPCQDPEWWQHVWITPERSTVDFTRDGQMLIGQLNQAYLNPAKFYAMRGEVAEIEIEETVRLRSLEKKLCKENDLELWEYAPGRYTNLGAALAPDPDEDEEDAGAKPAKKKKTPVTDPSPDEPADEDDDDHDETED